VDGAVGILHLKGELLFTHQKLQVDQIAGSHPVDAEQPIAGLNAQLLPDRLRLDPIHQSRLRQARFLGIHQHNAG
jgi:hypothetical protein